MQRVNHKLGWERRQRVRTKKKGEKGGVERAVSRPENQKRENPASPRHATYKPNEARLANFNKHNPPIPG